jgi:hypothetical protein
MYVVTLCFLDAFWAKRTTPHIPDEEFMQLAASMPKNQDVEGDHRNDD